MKNEVTIILDETMNTKIVEGMRKSDRIIIIWLVPETSIANDISLHASQV